MIRVFKGVEVETTLQPGHTLTVASIVFLILAFCLSSLVPGTVAAACLLSAFCWRRCKSTPVGANFWVMPSMPFIDGKPYIFLYQRAQRDAEAMDCHKLRASLIHDKNEINEKLPAGIYKTITHEPVLRVLEHCDRVHIIGQPRPFYMDTLHHILKAQTKGRCGRCKNRCASWRAKPRMFYSVCFSVD